MTDLNIDGLRNIIWDCIVIGAGPAGAIAARQIARENKEVLLIDKENFPRAKVCGCCINASAAKALEIAGLGSLLQANGAKALDTLRLFNDKKSADLVLSQSVVLAREKLDMSLINSAISYGVKFLSGANAKVLSLNPLPTIELQKDESKLPFKAKLIVVADGLSGRSLSLLPQFNSQVQNNSLFGASVILNQSPEFIENGKIYMACGKGGYVGMVALEDGRLNMAAAFSHKFSRELDGPALVAMHLLRDNALPIPERLAESRWMGTNLLTRARLKIADHRLFVIGDAAAYAEPFTGEGIAWALWSGLTVSKLAIQGINNWSARLIQQWQLAQADMAFDRARCRLITLLLRNDILRRVSVNVCAEYPKVINPLVQTISGSVERG